jgi:hypothetical protein
MFIQCFVKISGFVRKLKHTCRTDNTGSHEATLSLQESPKKKNSVALVHKRTIATERLPLVCEVSATASVVW